MNHWIQPSHVITPGSSSGPARSQQITQIRSALDGIIGQQQDREEATLNALIDFFVCRSRSTQQLHRIGAELFAALNREASVSVTTGVFDEQFTFRRAQDSVQIEVDHQTLARIPLDSAIRLATSLHGARDVASGRQCAA